MHSRRYCIHSILSSPLSGHQHICEQHWTMCTGLFFYHLWSFVAYNILCCTYMNVHNIHNCLHALYVTTNPSLSCVKASEALVEVSGDVLWMGNTAPSVGGAVHLTSHAQLRLHPSANLTFVSNRGRYASTSKKCQCVIFNSQFMHSSAFGIIMCATEQRS